MEFKNKPSFRVVEVCACNVLCICRLVIEVMLMFIESLRLRKSVLLMCGTIFDVYV